MSEKEYFQGVLLAIGISSAVVIGCVMNASYRVGEQIEEHIDKRFSEMGTHHWVIDAETGEKEFKPKSINPPPVELKELR